MTLPQLYNADKARARIPLLSNVDLLSLAHTVALEVSKRKLNTPHEIPESDNNHGNAVRDSRVRNRTRGSTASRRADQAHA